MQTYTRGELRQEIFNGLTRAGIPTQSYTCPERGMILAERRPRHVYGDKETLQGFRAVGGPTHIWDFILCVEGEDKYSLVHGGLETKCLELAEMIRAGGGRVGRGIEVDVCTPVPCGRDTANMYISFFYST